MARITNKQYYELCELMKERKDEFLQDRPTFATVARKLSKEFGVDYIAKQIVSAAKTIGIYDEWVKYKPTNAGNNACRCDELENKLNLLVGAVHQLYIEHGLELTSGLYSLVFNAPPEDLEEDDE